MPPRQPQERIDVMWEKIRNFLREYWQNTDGLAKGVLLFFVVLDTFAFYTYMKKPGVIPWVGISVSVIILILLNAASLLLGQSLRKIKLEPAIKNDPDELFKAKTAMWVCGGIVALILIIASFYRISQYERWVNRGMMEWMMTFTPIIAIAVEFVLGLTRGSELDKIVKQYQHALKDYLASLDIFKQSLNKANQAFGHVFSDMPRELYLTEFKKSDLKKELKNVSSSDSYQSAIDEFLNQRSNPVQNFLDQLSKEISSNRKTMRRKRAWRLFDNFKRDIARHYEAFKDKLVYIFREMTKDENGKLITYFKDPLTLEPRYENFGRNDLLMQEKNTNGKTELEEFETQIEVEFGKRD